MDLRQEAHRMIDELPTEESLRYMVEAMRYYFALSPGVDPPAAYEGDADAKLRALEHMEELRRTCPVPTDYDLEEARREAMEAKYGRFT